MMPDELGEEAELELNRITDAIIGCAFRVSNALGVGFMGKVYENAMVYELRKKGVEVRQQCSVPVFYEGVVVGEYVADLVVSRRVIVELKSTQEQHVYFVAQCLNYLKATGLPLCLLLNFGKPRLDVRRFRHPKV